MNQMLSSVRAGADEETKAFCKMISVKELEKYYVEKKRFKEKYGEEAFEAQTLKRKNGELAKELEAKVLDQKKEMKRLKRAKHEKKTLNKQDASSAAKKQDEKSQARMKNEDVQKKPAAKPESIFIQQNVSENERWAQDRNSVIQLLKAAREERIKAANLAMLRQMNAYTSNPTGHIEMSALFTHQPDRNESLLSREEKQLLGIQTSLASRDAKLQEMLAMLSERQLLGIQTSLASRDAQLREMLAMQSERISTLIQNSILRESRAQDDIRRSVLAPRYKPLDANEDVVSMLRNQNDEASAHQTIAHSYGVELNDSVDKEKKLHATVAAHYDRLQALQKAKRDAASLTRLGQSLVASKDTRDIHQSQAPSRISPHLNEASIAHKSPSTQNINKHEESLTPDSTQFPISEAEGGLIFCQPVQAGLGSASSKTENIID